MDTFCNWHNAIVGFFIDIIDDTIWRWGIVDDTTHLVVTVLFMMTLSLLVALTIFGLSFLAMSIGVKFHRVVSPADEKCDDAEPDTGAECADGTEPPEPPEQIEPRHMKMPRLIHDRINVLVVDSLADPDYWNSQLLDTLATASSTETVQRVKGELTRSLWEAVFSGD